jgi:hypothetical protein
MHISAEKHDGKANLDPDKKILQEILGRTTLLLSFDTTRTS